MSDPNPSDPAKSRPPSIRRWARIGALALLLAPIAVPAPVTRAEEPVVPYQIVNASAIPASLTGRPGDASAGRALYFDAALTGCSGCHGAPGGAGPGKSGLDNSGPDGDTPALDGVALRLSPGAIRLWLVAPEVLSQDTKMPAFYAVGQRNDPKDLRFGEPQLTASQIEDLIAFLLEAGR